MSKYTSESEYLRALEEQNVLPAGFKLGVTGVSFYPEELPVVNPMWMNLSAIVLDKPTENFAGVFTRNAFPGAPVLIGKKRLEEPPIRGVIINNKIANVCAKDGQDTAEGIAASFAECIGAEGREFFTASTGVIGWKLPLNNMYKALPELASNLGKTKVVDTARAIMTTDNFAKAHTARCGQGHILGIAKGAGMIEPNMATMLVFLLTDVDVNRDTLRKVLSEVSEDTFNSITVDGDQSTSDMALLFSSGKKPAVPEATFKKSLFSVCRNLAEDIVRNGEGTAHVIEAAVHSAPDNKIAKDIGKAVVNSPLVKTAVNGNDPNVGRLVMAIGDYIGNSGVDIDSTGVEIALGGYVIFRGGCFLLDSKKEEQLVEYLRSCSADSRVKGYPQNDTTVEIIIHLGAGSGKARVYGSDLSHEYIRENAEYRS